MAEGKGRGGPRTPGPGKRLGRPVTGAMRNLSVRVTDAQRLRLEDIGLGNASEGLRRLLAWYDREHPDECYE